MNDRFLKVTLEFVFPHECEFDKGHYGDLNYVRAEHDPNDPGGTTKWGIDQRSHPDVNIEKLDKNGALEIYWHTYWNGGTGADGNLIPVCDPLPLGLGESHYDARINTGKGQAAKFLEEASGSTDTYNDLREHFYRQLAADKPRFERYLHS